MRGTPEEQRLAAEKWLQAKTDVELVAFKRDLRIKYGDNPTIEQRVDELTELTLGLVVMVHMLSEEKK